MFNYLTLTPVPGCATHDYGLQGEWEECGLCCAKPHQYCMGKLLLFCKQTLHVREASDCLVQLSLGMVSS